MSMSTCILRRHLLADLDKDSCKKAAELITWGSVDLSSANSKIEDMLQKSDAFDGSVPGVQHMPGGQKAAHARWEAFKKNGLSQYAARRNNAMLRYVLYLTLEEDMLQCIS